jgi:hypothetical protein
LPSSEPVPPSGEKANPSQSIETAPAPATAELSLAEQLAQAPVDEKLAADLDRLLKGTGEEKIEPGDASSFWDALSEKEESNRPLSPDMLTYEQARQMGLAPEDLKA